MWDDICDFVYEIKMNLYVMGFFFYRYLGFVFFIRRIRDEMIIIKLVWFINFFFGKVFNELYIECMVCCNYLF